MNLELQSPSKYQFIKFLIQRPSKQIREIRENRSKEKVNSPSGNSFTLNQRMEREEMFVSFFLHCRDTDTIEGIFPLINSCWKEQLGTPNPPDLCLNSLEPISRSKRKIKKILFKQDFIMKTTLVPKQTPLREIFEEFTGADCIKIEMCPAYLAASIQIKAVSEQGKEEGITRVSKNYAIYEHLDNILIESKLLFGIILGLSFGKMDIQYRNFYGERSRINRQIDNDEIVQMMKNVRHSEEVWRSIVFQYAHLQLNELDADLSKEIRMKIRVKKNENFLQGLEELMEDGESGIQNFLRSTFCNFDKESMRLLKFKEESCFFQ